MSDEVDFLHADKHQNFLQVEKHLFYGLSQAFRKCRKQFAISS